MIQIKEEFVGCEKWERAVALGGAEAIQLWLAMKRYAAAMLTDGFVPDSEMRVLKGAPRRYQKALKALIECGQEELDGSRGAGLVDPAERGWMLHDYLDHANSSDEEALRKERYRVKKALQREAKRLELVRLQEELARLTGRDNQGDTPGTTRGTPSETHHGTPRETPGVRPQGTARMPVRGPAHTRTGPPAIPTQPNPTQPPDGGDPQPPPSVQADSNPDPFPLRSFDSALGLPIIERAQRLLAEKHNAQWCEPERWPELVEVVRAWETARGLPTGKLQPWHVDPVVKTLVEAFAVGYDEVQLRQMASSFAVGELVRKNLEAGKRPSLAWLKGEALRTEAERLPVAQPLGDLARRALESIGVTT